MFDSLKADVPQDEDDLDQTFGLEASTLGNRLQELNDRSPLQLKGIPDGQYDSSIEFHKPLKGPHAQEYSMAELFGDEAAAKLTHRDLLQNFEQSLPFAKTLVKAFFERIEEAESICGDEGFVTIEVLAQEFAVADLEWKPLLEPHS